jgi:hemerythrin superfamily protein
MNALELLVGQHRLMESSFKKLLEADAGARRGQLDGPADVLMSHVLVEEEVFYPKVRAARTEDILLESLEEHLSLKRVLADLLAMDPADPHFEAKLHVLEEQARHHHKEEEENLFPKVRRLFTIEELIELGEQMIAAQQELLRGEPRRRVFTQTAAAAEI